MTSRGFVGGLITGSVLGMAVGMLMVPEAREMTSRRMVQGSRELGQKAQRVFGRAQMRARDMMDPE